MQGFNFNLYLLLTKKSFSLIQEKPKEVTKLTKKDLFEDDLFNVKKYKK